jgi:uncharacterized membrane protein
MEIWISRILRWGVLAAGSIIALGLLLLLVRQAAPGMPASLHDLRSRGASAMGVNLAGILGGALHGDATSIIQTGLLALILTPVARVAMTAVLFFAQRDRVFTAVTCVVLALLILGLTGVGA